MDVTPFYLIAALALWATIDPRLPTGIIGTLGLMSLFIGSLATTDNAVYLERAVELRTWGLVAVGWGVLWHVVVRGWCRELSTRWYVVYLTARFWGIERRRAHRGDFPE